MCMYNVKLNALSAFIGGIVGYLWGGLDVMLTALLLFMLIDMITGIVKGRKKLESNALYNGILKKCGILVVLFICVQMDLVFKLQVLRTACCMFYIANEGLSILENLAVIGVAIPKFITDKLAVIKKESEETQNGE